MRIFWFVVLFACFCLAQPRRGSPQIPNYEKPDFKGSEGPRRGSSSGGGSLIAISYQAQETQFLLDFGFSNYSSSTLIDRTGQNYTTNDRLQQSVSFGLTYGIADYLSLSVSGNYYLKDTEDTKYGPLSTTPGLTTSSDADGFGDPAFGTSVRLMGQANYFVNFDLAAQIRPGIVPAQYGTSTKKGTKGSGGFITAFGGQLSRDFGLIGISGKVVYLYNDLRAKTDPDGRNKSEYSGGNSLVLGLTGLIRPIDQLGIFLGLDYYSVAAEEIRTVSTNTFSNLDSYNFLSFSVTGQVEIIPGSLLLEGSYRKNMDQKTKFTSNNSTYDINSSSSTFGVGLKSAF